MSKALQQALADMTDHVDELTRKFATHERHVRFEKGKWRPKTHKQDNPSLLAQLRLQAGSVSPDEGAARPAPGSRLPGDVEALTYLLTIEQQSKHLEQVLGLTHRPDAEGRIQGLAAHARQIAADKPNTADNLTRSIRSWYLKARYGTGWAAQPFHVRHAQCPALITDTLGNQYLCAKTTLVVSNDGKHAWCETCACTWNTQSEIEDLANIIRGDAEPAKEEKRATA